MPFLWIAGSLVCEALVMMLDLSSYYEIGEQRLRCDVGTKLNRLD